MTQPPEWTARRSRSRRDRVRATRDLVVAKASTLFIERGYVQTTMADIAAAAGVAVQTLYLRFGGKVAILATAFDQAAAGDAEEVAIADRPWVDELKAAPDFPVAARLLVRNTRRILERATPLFTRIEQASADPEVAQLLAESKRRKYETTGILARILRDKPGFERRLSLAQTTDVLFGLASEELFRLWCHERGWSHSQWEDFTLAVLINQLGEHA